MIDHHITYSPVIIPTLCRSSHFTRCVESLSRCTGAGSTDLYIALDYPLRESHHAGYTEITEYIKNIQGFKSVNVIKREKNFGAVNNLHDAIAEVVRNYEMFILSEDDNEFSPNFLEYMNRTLQKFENDESVLAVTAYNRMIDTTGYDANIYAAKSYSGWGTGYLRKDIEFILEHVTTESYAYQILKSWKQSLILYKRYPSLLHGLLSIVKTGHVTGDTLVVSYMVLNNKYCIWPTLSKVRNHGFDGGGEHFGSVPDHPLLTQEIDTETSFEPDDIAIEENALMRRLNEKYGKQTSVKELLFCIYIPVRYLIYRLTGKIIYK